MTGAPHVELSMEDPRWAGALPDPEATAREGAALALAAAGLPPEAHAVGFLFADDDEIARLNADFRGKTGATNVLSWPAFPLAPPSPGKAPPPPPAQAMPGEDGAPVELGDVALAFETVASEAQARGISVESHVVHLILHGVLHLCGYDHQTEADARLMEGLESAALVAAGRADPYLAPQGADGDLPA